jgi:hypothetical protein
VEDGRVILKVVLGEVGWENVDWIHLVHHRGNWWAFFNTMVKLRIPYIAGKFFY